MRRRKLSAQAPLRQAANSVLKDICELSPEKLHLQRRRCGLLVDHERIIAISRAGSRFCAAQHLSDV